MGREPLDVDLCDYVAVVTGANRGMGKETALALARMGAHACSPAASLRPPSP
jgi:NAD(P)-dependent dehydrogenase (short-subunit alcohol dehydrogenase family)